jgi:hypothetical protein
MRRWSIAAALAGLALALAGTALAYTFIQRGSVTLTAFKAGKSTGLKASLNSQTNPPGKTPWSTKTVRITFPEGTKFGLGRFKACTLTDSQIKSGRTCPSDTRIGTGKTTASPIINGRPNGVVQGTVTAYIRTGGKMVQVVKSGGQTLVIHTTVSRNVLSISVPQIHALGYPVVLTSFTLNVPARGKGSSSLIRAGKCVKNSFVVKTHFVYTNGKTKDLKSQTFCTS